MLRDMATDPRYQPISADEFLAMDFATDRKFELSNGVIQMMTGGTETHAWVSLNLTSWLRRALRGSGCRPYGSEMGVRVTEIDVRYPDASIFCGSRPPHGSNIKALHDPVVVIEVLSPTTATYDQGTKLEEYQSIASVQLIVFLDPINELVSTYERTPRGWFHQTPKVRDLVIARPAITIPHAEIFARD